jgi:hypothetical protein
MGRRNKALGEARPCTLPMSDLPLIATGKRTSFNVGFVPIADIAERLFDHLVGTGEQRRRHSYAKRFCGGQVDDKVELGRLLDRNIARLATA